MNETQNVRFSIARKLLLLFAGLCVGFSALVGFAVWHLTEVGHELSAILGEKVPSLLATSRIKNSLFGQQEVVDTFVAGLETPESAAVKFREAGADANRLLGDDPEGREFRGFVEATLAKEQREGHLAQEKRDALDIAAMVGGYSEFVKAAESLFGSRREGSNASIDHAAADRAGSAIVARVYNFDRVSLDFIKEDAGILLAEQRSVTIAIAVLGAVILLLAIWITTALVRRITQPLVQLAAGSSRIAAGDLTVEPATFRSGDEIEVLADSFSKMSHNLREQILEIRKGVEMLGTSIGEIGASIQEQAASAKEEAATIQEITTTMQEIQQSGLEISQRAKEVSSGAETTLDAGEAGLEAVRRTSESMERIREQVEEVAEKIVNLSEKTQAIGEIVATVNEIAEQSNILAINASIEAASAGESGSRFSVVAQEMKHLADQAKSSTKVVRGILEEIQKGINTSVMLTEEAVKRTEAGRSQAGVAQGNIHKLAESIQGSVQTFQQIIAGTGQQQIGINQVVQGMQDIKQAVQQTVTGISQLEQATRSLNEMGANLRAYVARYKL